MPTVQPTEQEIKDTKDSRRQNFSVWIVLLNERVARILVEAWAYLVKAPHLVRNEEFEEDSSEEDLEEVFEEEEDPEEELQDYMQENEDDSGVDDDDEEGHEDYEVDDEEITLDLNYWDWDFTESTWQEQEASDSDSSQGIEEGQFEPPFDSANDSEDSMEED
ncbi:unnamed protein product [Sympodiomycopsis kandeliae]